MSSIRYIKNSTVRGYVDLARPENASSLLITYSIGYVISLKDFSLNYIIGLIIIICLHSYATVQNDIEDISIDAANLRTGIIQDNKLSIQNARKYSYLYIFIATGSALLSANKLFNLGVIIAGLILAHQYNSGNHRASKRPIASITILAFCFGPFALLYGYYQVASSLSYVVLILCILLFCGRFSTAILKDYKDAKGDKKFHKDTFYIHYGQKITGWVSLCFALICYVGLLTFLLYHKDISSFIYWLAALVMTLLIIRNIYMRFGFIRLTNEKKLSKLFVTTLKNHNLIEGLFFICIFLVF
ncbi:MAG: UbiA prenyltransferase family protein [Candidatus Saccharimonadales bacterium]